jgi:hypothetical protein
MALEKTELSCQSARLGVSFRGGASWCRMLGRDQVALFISQQPPLSQRGPQPHHSMKLTPPIFTPGLSSVAAASLLQIAQAASRSLFICLALAPALQAQVLDPQAEFQAQSRPHLETLPSGEKSLQWSGQTGQTYFLQSSTDLSSWNWLPTIQSGVTAPMSNPVSSTAPANFFRLVRTNKTAVNPYTADFDGDGLSNLEEITARPRPGGTASYPDLNPNIQTSPLDNDTDHDGLGDKWEQEHNLDPTDDGTLDIKNSPNGDPDDDGVSNSEEQANGTDPENANDFSLQYVGISKISSGHSNNDIQLGYQNTGRFNWRANWFDDRHVDLSSNLNATPSDLLSLITNIEFSALPPAQIWQYFGDGPGIIGSYYSNADIGNIISCWKDSSTQPLRALEGQITIRRIWLKALISTHDRKFEFFRQKTKTVENAYLHVTTRECISTEKITMLIPAGQTYSAPLDIEATPDLVEGYSIRSIANVSFSPPGRAPEVLAVNSDFDEGRIDPITGYAIPDCDDMPGVDPETGAGNTKLELSAARNHLDGTFAQSELVVKDLHKGWFGMRPDKYDSYHFYEGANVTVRKVDKIDADTSYKESGQVRFYAKWNGGYYGISPYDFKTLQPVNLVSGGVNGRPGEGIYGTSSTIPNNAEFYMEGVRPGKITLEWRYQKGSTDFKFEQTFEVCTHKNASQWKTDLAYKIRLETSNDPSGQIYVQSMNLPSESYKTRMERVSEYYDYYQDCFLSSSYTTPAISQTMSWPGLARLAGSQVVGGLSDSEYGRQLLEVGSVTTTPLPDSIKTSILTWSIAETKALQQALFSGGRTIFESIGWQMHAYRSSGYRALDWVATETGELESDALVRAKVWKNQRLGTLGRNKVLLDKVGADITDREQNVTIVPTWTTISGLGFGLVDNMFSILGKNSSTPAGLNFSDLFPQIPISTGSLANTADRWTWIKPATPNGILDTWNKQPFGIRDTLVSRKLGEDARRFSIISNFANPLPIPVLVWDNEDVP